MLLMTGFARLQMFPKAVLRCPPHAGKKKRYVMKALLHSRLERWLAGDLVALWRDTRLESSYRPVGPSKNVTVTQSNIKRAVAIAREGNFAKAVQSLGSSGTAAPNDMEALDELLHRHPQHALPDWSNDIPPSLTVSPDSVFAALRGFPKASSPGASQLQCQHLLDAIDANTSPSAKDCLDRLTRLLCFLLSGRADVRIAPWLCGAPLTALFKKQGGIRPIVVGEILRRLTSRLCCSAMKAVSQDVFLPYGQVGVGTRGGLEAAIHSLSTIIDLHGNDPDLCCLKVDFQNAFNES